MEKLEEIKKAKERRARLLAEAERTGWTYIKLAKKYKITASRIGQMIRMAKEEAKG